MEFKFRPADERGHADYGWLHARYTFSFSEYYDRSHCGFHSLMVMNNDIIEPGGGFPMHPHKNAEIFTYVISGKLEHKDSMGNRSVIDSGELQYMSAGNGIRHSEFNPSNTDQTELYQIWMQSNQIGGNPRYAKRKVGLENFNNESQLLFSKDGKYDSIQIRQNAEFYIAYLNATKSLSINTSLSLPHLWIQNISGEITLNDYTLKKSDGLGITNLKEKIELEAKEESSFFIFRLAQRERK